MLIIGLTGGIGAGKTTVSEHFGKLGVPIIDADIIAREVVEPGKSALVKIKDYFGAEILQKDGHLDRTKLRNIVFRNAEHRIWLEVLLHPIIIDEMQKQAEQASKSAPYVLVVIPLMQNRKEYRFLDRVLVVDSSKEQQLERVKQRDNTNNEAIEAIMATQLIREDRLKFADDVITNDGPVEELEAKVKELHEKYLSLAQ